jgi:hypothetical protein
LTPVKASGLDQAEYLALCAEADRLVRQPEFTSKQSVIEALLNHGCVLDRDKLEQIDEAITVRLPSLEHKRVDANARATTELGEFSAIAAAYSVDHQGDEIVPGAFAKTIDAWRESGKQIPLHWNHRARAEDSSGRSTRPRCARSAKASTCAAGSTSTARRSLARRGGR